MTLSAVSYRLSGLRSRSGCFGGVGSAIGLALALAGCAEYRAAIDTATELSIESKRYYNDKQARVLVAALCDVTIGAWGRMENPALRDSLMQVCDPAAARSPLSPATLDLLRTIIAVEGQRLGAAAPAGDPLAGLAPLPAD